MATFKMESLGQDFDLEFKGYVVHTFLINLQYLLAE